MTQTQLAAKTKITKATVKTFIKGDGLLIQCLTRFNGMVDGVDEVADQSIKPAELTHSHLKETLRIQGCWFVGRGGIGGDYFERYETPEHYGIRVSNCCGSFLLLRAK